MLKLLSSTIRILLQSHLCFGFTLMAVKSRDSSVTLWDYLIGRSLSCESFLFILALSEVFL